MPRSTSDADTRRTALTEALQRVGQKDVAALAQVYDATSAKLFGICLRISNNREAAEDILQEVYLKIWNRAEAYDASRASPISWLCVIARNAAIDWLRSDHSMKMAPQSAADGIADDRVQILAKLEQKQDVARVMLCLDTIDAQKSEVIRHAFFDGLSYVELSERMAVPLGTMKSWIRRGLQQLKKCLGDGE